jgi:hypothetical protein
MRFADFSAALDWYVHGYRTAEDATRASGVSEAAQRQMQKLKIFSPVPQPERTAKRLLFNSTVMRLAIAGELNRCGIPLVPASKIIHADMWIEDFLIGVVDPFQMFFDGFDQKTKRYIRREGEVDPDGLYDPTKPVTPHKTDQFIEIINNRYVISKPFADEEGHVLGELMPDKSDFIVWYGATFNHIIAGEKLRPTLIDDSGLRAITSKKPTPEDEENAGFARANPTSKLSVNAGMALRAALRRLLYIDKPLEQ